ncbi:MAG TPA: hypothetical protein DCP26_07640, partial [Brevundimonas sp.]|nr:hypothetical protein [Brevundimonas sp.]
MTATAVGLTKIGVMAAIGEGATIALAGAAVKTGAMIGLSVAAAALMRPNTPSSGTTLDFKPDPKAPVRGAMGYTALGGNKVFQATWGYKKVAMSLGVALSLGPIDQVPRFEADGATVTFSGPQSEATGFYAADMWQRTTLGLPGDAALLPPTGLKYGNPGLTGWGTQHAAPQVSFSFWTMVLAKNPEDRDVFTNGVPDPRWVGRWMKLWDPRKDSTYPGGSGPQRRDDWRTWEWSESPYVHALAWCRGHYKLNLDGTIDRTKRIAGIGAPDAAIDIPAFVEGMNVAQANDWTISGEWSTSDGKFQTLLAMLQAGGGEPISRGAQISVMVNAPRVATYTYTRDDLIGQAEIRPLTPRRERKNTIIPRYKSEANGWQYVPAGEVTSSVYRDEDRGEPRSLEIEYSHVRSAKQAAQLAAYDLANLREGLTATLPSKVHLMHVHPGACIKVDVPELALAGQKFIVRRATTNHQSASVTLELRSESDAKHAWALGQAAQPAPSPSLSAVDPKYVPPPAPEDWTVVPKPPSDGGVSQPIVVIELPIETTDIVTVIIKHGPSATGPWTDGYEGSPRTDGRYEVAGLTPGQTYCFSLQYVAKNGAKSEPDIKCGIVAGELTAGNVIPTAPTIVGLQGQINAAFGDIFNVSELVADARTQLDAQGAEIAAARGGQATLSARISQVNQARIDGDEANAIAINGVAARTAHTEADIIDLENALANETMARAEAVGQLTARQALNPNLTPNGNFEQGSAAGWELPAGFGAGYSSFNGGWIAYGELTSGTVRNVQAPLTSVSSDVAAIQSSQIAYRMASNAYVAACVMFFDAGYGYIGQTPWEPLAPTTDWTVWKAEAYTKPAAAAWSRIVVTTGGTEGFINLRQAKTEAGSVCTIYSSDASVSSLSATVTEQSLAIVDLENQQSLAAWHVVAEASGGKPARIGIASSALGTYVALDAPYIFWGDNTVFEDATDTLQTTVGENRRVLAFGAPFGASGNLLEWWGPATTALGTMTTGNGLNGRMTTAPYVFDNVIGGGKTGGARSFSSGPGGSSAQSTVPGVLAGSMLEATGAINGGSLDADAPLFGTISLYEESGGVQTLVY